MKKNITILGALPDTEERINLYNSIIEACKSFAWDILSPIDTANFKWDDRERYARAFKTIQNADLVIGECSQPSTGEGMEIKECEYSNKPLIIVAKEGSKVSWLAKACPATKGIIYYRDVEHLKLELADVLRSY